MMPSQGKATSGISEVAGMGMASVIHQMTIRKATAAVRAPAGDIPAGKGSSSISANARGPATNPILRAFIYLLS